MEKFAYRDEKGVIDGLVLIVKLDEIKHCDFSGRYYAIARQTFGSVFEYCPGRDEMFKAAARFGLMERMTLADRMVLKGVSPHDVKQMPAYYLSKKGEAIFKAMKVL